MSVHSRRRFLKTGAQLLGASALLAGGGNALAGLAPPGHDFQNLTPEDRRRRRFVNNVLTTHEGQQVRLYDDLIKDKIVLINFMYSVCKNEGFCPTMSLNLSKVQKLFGERLGHDVFMYSITLDPAQDTPERLATYAQLFHAKPGGWLFLTGKAQDIADVRENLGFRWADPQRDRDRQEHIGVLKYGIEPLERWGTCPALTRPEAIVSYLDWMSPQGTRLLR